MSAATPSPTATPKPKADEASKPKKPKGLTKAQKQAREDAVAEVRDQGFTTLKPTDYDPKATLRVLIGAPGRRRRRRLPRVLLHQERLHRQRRARRARRCEISRKGKAHGHAVLRRLRAGRHRRPAERPQARAVQARGRRADAARHDPVRQRPVPAPQGGLRVGSRVGSDRGGPMEPSYASGTSTTPLLGDTIGDNLDRTIARFGDREALVSVHQDLRYTYAQFGEAVDRARARVHRRRDRAGRPGRDLEPELRRVGARPVRDGEGRDHPGQHQPGLPDVRARLRAQPVRLQDARRGDRVQDVATTCRWSTTSAATATGLERVVFIGRDWEEFIAGGERVSAGRAARAPGRDPVRRPDQHPVHERHHRLPQGRHAQPPQHPQQRLLRRPRLPLHRGGPGLHPGALLPLLRHGHGQPRRARRTAPAWSSRRRRSTRSRRCRPCRTRTARASTACRRCSSPSSSTRSSPSSTSRQPADRDHGRLAVPDRDDEALRGRDAHGGGDDLLRHDRDLAGVDADRRRRPAREARRHRGPRAPARRGQGRRRPRPARSSRAASPASCARAATA